VYPNFTRRAASVEGVPLPWLCAILMLESSGGLNVWGHDPTIWVGAGPVTQAGYKAYAAVRDRTEECQGCGPMQLTDAGLQRQADAAGGCWEPEHNIAVGAHFLAGLAKQHGGWGAATAAAYNGGGPLAEQYGQRAAALEEHFAALLT
jgi:transglycosylase-like protein with SLT domain